MLGGPDLLGLRVDTTRIFEDFDLQSTRNLCDQPSAGSFPLLLCLGLLLYLEAHESCTHAALRTPGLCHEWLVILAPGGCFILDVLAWMSNGRPDRSAMATF